MDEFRYNEAQIKNDVAGMTRKQNQMKVDHSLFTLLGITRFFPLYCMGAYLLLCRVSQYRCIFDLIHRDYFMVGECVRFLFTSCEGSLNERVSAANE